MPCLPPVYCRGHGRNCCSRRHCVYIWLLYSSITVKWWLITFSFRYILSLLSFFRSVSAVIMFVLVAIYFAIFLVLVFLGPWFAVVILLWCSLLFLGCWLWDLCVLSLSAVDFLFSLSILSFSVICCYPCLLSCSLFLPLPVLSVSVLLSQVYFGFMKSFFAMFDKVLVNELSLKLLSGSATLVTLL